MIRFANAEDDRSKVVSALTEIEARSAICRLHKEKKLTGEQASLAVNALDGDIRRIIQQPVLPAVLEAANAVVERHYLRALDAVQLASAIVARDLLAAPDMRFIASDKALLLAAHEEGFEIWNPCDDQPRP
jgi:predicted nucleic acid-binding protein